MKRMPDNYRAIPQIAEYRFWLKHGSRNVTIAQSISRVKREYAVKAAAKIGFKVFPRNVTEVSRYVSYVYLKFDVVPYVLVVKVDKGFQFPKRNHDPRVKR
jgi:hypothetical protein